jgi:drug/metabolite transporter (DMT)-like permease
MTRSFQTGPTSVVSLVTYLGLVWAGLGGALLFDEPLTFGLLVGAVLIVGAVIGTSRLRTVTPAVAKVES